MSVEEEPGITMRVKPFDPRLKLEAQIASWTKEELSFEIDLLIQSAKEEAGLCTHPARKIMEMNVGVNGGNSIDAEYRRIGRYEDIGGTEQMDDSDEEAYGPMLPTPPSASPQAVQGFNYTNAHWPAGQPTAHLIAEKEC